MHYRKTLFWEFFLALVLILASGAYGLGWYFTWKVEQTLDAYISKNIQEGMEPAAQMFNAKLLSLLLPGDEETSLYLHLQTQAVRLITLLKATSLVIFDAECHIRLSVPKPYFIGQAYPIVETDPGEVKQAWAGQVACSGIYYADGEAFKTGYAPIRDQSGRVVFVVCMEIGASHHEIIRKFRELTIYFSLAGVVIAFFASLLWWLSLTQPLRQLTTTMEAVSQRKQYQQLATTRRDELGFLIWQFNYMMAALQDKEAELTRIYQEKLKHKQHLALLGEFSAGVAHEIRNPLAAMEGFAGLLMRKVQEPEKKELIERLLSEIHALNHIVGQILDYARPTPCQPEPTPLFGLIHEVLTTCLAMPAANNVQVKLQLDPQIPTLLVDPQSIKQALVNLVRNSIQAMEHTPLQELTIRTALVANEMALSIQDTGEGISSDKQVRLFQPFFTTRDQGTGLGLPIAQKIVEQNGGRIQIESALGRGTCVTLLFPAPQPSLSV